MSPTKYQDSEVTTKGGMINNGKRLSINKESHVIQNVSSSSSPPSSSSIIENNSKQTKRQPVIIYTHTPKVIHVQPHEFMAIVQKLTGMPRSDSHEKAAVKEEENTSFSIEKDCACVKNNVGYGGENEASSDLMKERFVGEEMKENNYSSNYAPLFTPNFNDFVYSSRGNSSFQSPNNMFLEYKM